MKRFIVLTGCLCLGMIVKGLSFNLSNSELKNCSTCKNISQSDFIINNSMFTSSSDLGKGNKFDFTGDWECPNLYGNMNICLTMIHNTYNNTVKVEYLVNYRLWTYENAKGWVENNTLHILQSSDDGSFIEIIATPINRTTIKGTLKYKNPRGKYNGKLIMNYVNTD